VVHFVRVVLACGTDFADSFSRNLACVDTIPSFGDNAERAIRPDWGFVVSSRPFAWLAKMRVRFLMRETFGEK
jgi:hypothetical protein